MESLAPLVLLALAFYLLVIRPTRSRQKAAVALQNRLAPGLQVMTGSGIYGRVAAVEDDVVSLEVSPGVQIRVAKPAVGRILSEDEVISRTDSRRGPDDPEADHTP